MRAQILLLNELALGLWPSAAAVALGLGLSDGTTVTLGMSIILLMCLVYCHLWEGSGCLLNSEAVGTVIPKDGFYQEGSRTHIHWLPTGIVDIVHTEETNCAFCGCIKVQDTDAFTNRFMHTNTNGYNLSAKNQIRNSGVTDQHTILPYLATCCHHSPQLSALKRWTESIM